MHDHYNIHFDINIYVVWDYPGLLMELRETRVSWKILQLLLNAASSQVLPILEELGELRNKKLASMGLAVRYAVIFSSLLCFAFQIELL